jgi:3-methylcrotonyl-CoA carboxylase alpha subunit
MAERRIILDGREVIVDDTPEVKLLGVEGDDAELLVGGRRVLVPFLRKGDVVQFLWKGEVYTAEMTRATARRKRSADHSTAAPMPGTVLKIFVEPGDVVAKGDPLLILEAMKMEHQIAAPHAGTITAIHCAEGELVQAGVDLISVEPGGE